MARGRMRPARTVLDSVRDEHITVEDGVASVPTVIDVDPPKVLIYGPRDDGEYWFRRIGFNRRITDED